MNPRHVLLVDSSGYEDLGGASTVLDEVIRRVDRTRYVPVLACLSPGRWPEQVRAAGTSAYSFPRTRLRSPANVLKIASSLAGVVRAERVDLIHASENSALLYAALAGRMASKPVVWHIHSPLNARSRAERVVAFLLRRLPPAHLVFTSPGTAAKTMPFGRVPSSVVFPGVDVERASRGDGGRARRALGLPPDVPIVSTFARVEPMKGQADLVRAVGLLGNDHADLHVVMCGPGDRNSPYRRHVDELSVAFHLEDRVVMPGDVRSPLKEDIVAASDVVAHPSHAEAFGLAVLEAMAAGKAVVAAATDGPTLLIEDDVSGVLVPPGDVERLAAAIDRLLDDPSERRRLGEEAARAARRYRVEDMVPRIEHIWDEVLGPTS
ncbi:MAG TPA: glycosyltransferase family 4 protein [Acidimicrobiales bacterium]|nr:glycosyltransferase family 4 protein [Acidimicrobiales bacterium]